MPYWYRVASGQIVKDKACSRERRWFWKWNRMASWDQKGKLKKDSWKGIGGAINKEEIKGPNSANPIDSPGFLQKLLKKLLLLLLNCSLLFTIIPPESSTWLGDQPERLWNILTDICCYTPHILMTSKLGRKDKPTLFCVVFERLLQCYQLTFCHCKSLWRVQHTSI